MSGVYITETAVDAVVAVLRDYLVTELAAIDSSKTDAIVLDKPSDSDIQPWATESDTLKGNILIEVFCDSASSPTDDLDGVPLSRITSECEVQVRASIVERSGSGRETLWRKSARTAAAIVVTCCSDYWDLGGLVESCKHITTTYRNLPGDQLVRQSTTRLLVRTRETVS